MKIGDAGSRLKSRIERTENFAHVFARCIVDFHRVAVCRFVNLPNNAFAWRRRGGGGGVGFGASPDAVSPRATLVNADQPGRYSQATDADRSDARHRSGADGHA